MSALREIHGSTEVEKCANVLLKLLQYLQDPPLFENTSPYEFSLNTHAYKAQSTQSKWMKSKQGPN